MRRLYYEVQVKPQFDREYVTVETLDSIAMAGRVAQTLAGLLTGTVRIQTTDGKATRNVEYVGTIFRNTEEEVQ